MTLRILGFSLFVLALAVGVLTTATPVTNSVAKGTSKLTLIDGRALETQPSNKAHEHDFDYLLGDWEFTGVNREHGKFRGYWSAVWLPETGQIMDEYRVVSSDGDTYYVSTTLRAYNTLMDQWELVSVDNRGTGLQNIGTGQRMGAEMRIEQKFGFGTSTSWISRIRYYDIRPDRFSWNADRSLDGGKTWIKDFQQIEARRIGPPRSVGPLAPTRKPAGAGSNP